MNATGRSPDRAADGTAWYVYGVVPADTPATVVERLQGVRDTRTGLVAEAGLGALVSEVPLAEFDDEPLASNLRDPAWLESGVRAHDSVLAAVARDAPVVPFRFGTIYRSEEQVRTMLAEHARLAEVLETLRGRIELGVKGFFADGDDGPAAAGDEPEASPGRRYLEQKQRDRRAAEEREALLARAADESHARLAAVADAARANPLQPPEASGRDAAMFLNGAYLVAAAKEQDFRRAIASLQAELGASGIVFELTGPWPPYNFVEVDA